MFIHLPNNTKTVTVNEALKAPIESTLTETALDLTSAFGCMIWISQETDEISATTYQGGEMIPAKIEATDAEKEILNRFADSLYS